MARLKTEILMDFMDAIEESIQNASQILVVWRDTRWHVVRETLRSIKKAAVNLAIHSAGVA